MAKELYKLELGLEITDFGLFEGGVLIKTADGKSIKIADHHDQDCCENVYADFSALEYYVKEIKGQTFESLSIKAVENIGFLLCFEQRWHDSVKALVPCYNKQNGYYSSALALVLERDGVKTEIDISDLTDSND